MDLSLCLETLALETGTGLYMNEERVKERTWVNRNSDARKNAKPELGGDQDKQCSAEPLVLPRQTIYPTNKPTAFNMKDNSFWSRENGQTLTQPLFERER